MDRNAELEGIRRSVHRDVHRDGLTEMVAGVVLFIVALATGRPAFYWTYLVVVVLLSRGLEWLRQRHTYPRIGLVRLEAEDRRAFSRGIAAWVVGAVVLVALVLALLGLVGDNLAWRRASPALAGMLFAGGLLHLARRTGLARIYGLTAASVVTGAIMVWPVVPTPYGNLRVWALLMSLLCLGVGGVAFGRFVRDTPVLEGWGDDAG